MTTSSVPAAIVPDRVPLPVLDCAPLLSGAPLDEQAAVRLAAVLRILADPARLRILSLLQAQPNREACVCHVTDHLGLAQPTVSHHLRVLFEAGLVERERRGNWVYYRGVGGALDRLREVLGGDRTPAEPAVVPARTTARNRRQRRGKQRGAASSRAAVGVARLSSSVK